MAFSPFIVCFFFPQRGVHFHRGIEVMGNYRRSWELAVTFAEHLLYARNNIRELTCNQAQALLEVGISINMLKRRKIKI